jgi:hypothetical protein
VLLNRQPRPYVLVAAGLLGIGLYAVAIRFWHPAILSNDLVQGVWYGLCVGVEILGLYLLRKSPPRNPSGCSAPRPR